VGDDDVVLIGAMAAFILYKVRTTCLECGESIAFEGPSLGVRCPGCQSAIEFDAKRWKMILGFRDQVKELGLQEGQIKNATSIFGYTVLIGFGPQRPLCSACSGVLDLSATPPGTDGVVRCPACGGTTPTFPPPPWLAAVEPAALQLFGAARSGGVSNAEAVASPNAARPVSFACPDCGGNLKITNETPRILACSYCSADLYLPDPLWRAIHPVKKRVPWVVAFRD
jgi:Zn finger protein HypA/HybF involved in hydrogenase expression